MITAEQKAHWETFGFLMLPQLFTPEETGAIREASIEVVKQNGGANALQGTEGWSIGGFMERHPLLTSLLDDDRIHDIPETILGPDFILEMTDGHVRGGDTAWHGRDPRKEPPGYSPRAHLRVAMYFDNLNQANGCLRVIPGSHRRPFADRLYPLWSQEEDPTHAPFGVVGTEVPSVWLASQPGDVIVFTERVYHASFGGKARLQLTSQYGANPATDEQLAEVRKQADEHKWGFHPAESSINSDRPRVRRMVSKLVELGFTPLKV